MTEEGRQRVAVVLDGFMSVLISLSSNEVFSLVDSPMLSERFDNLGSKSSLNVTSKPALKSVFLVRLK